jgi:hypothetical protein
VSWFCSAIDEGKELLDIVDHGTEQVRYTDFSTNPRIFRLTS